MLYDPKWENNVKADPFSLESLIAWLEKQPADTMYCYDDTGGCLHHQYFTAVGVEMWRGVAGTHVRLKSGEYVNLSIGFIRTASMEPHTFGAALERARDLLSLRG